MKVKIIGGSLVGVVLIGASIGCFVGGDDDEMATDPAGGVGGADPGDATSAAGSAGSGGPSAAGGSSAKACPEAPGPTMVRVEGPEGTPYCIDTTEVTQGQYQEFLAKVATKPGTEHNDCALNTTYEPENHLPGGIDSVSCVEAWTPERTPNRPVVCVSWCDATAYCAWAGKRLCGKIGGGQNALDAEKFELPDDPAADAKLSEWFNVCSQGGQTSYPYGDVHQPTACEGIEVSKTADGAWLPKADAGERLTCSGQTEPYSKVFDLSGSVSELTNECRKNTAGNSMLCATRGGNRGSEGGQLACAAYGGASFEQQSDFIGFRCCGDESQ